MCVGKSMGWKHFNIGPVDEIKGEAPIVWKRAKYFFRPTWRNYWFSGCRTCWTGSGIPEGYRCILQRPLSNNSKDIAVTTYNSRL